MTWLCTYVSDREYENFSTHVGHFFCMNPLHVGHFEFMQDNFTDNITFIELGKLVTVISVFVLFPLMIIMMVTEKCQYLWF